MPLDPWIIEEILKREREKKEEQDRGVIEISIEDGREMPAERPSGSDHEMPADRKPGHEMPNPNEPARHPAEKKEDADRGVTTIDIGGGSTEEEDPNVMDISKILEKTEDEKKKDDEKLPE